MKSVRAAGCALGVRRGDLVAALALTVVGLVEAGLGLTGPGPTWVVVTVPLVTLGLAVRASHARHVLVLALAVQLVQSAAGSDLAGGFTEPLVLVVLVYTLAARSDLRAATGWLGVACLGVVAVVSAGGSVRTGNYVFALTLVGAAWLGGRGARLAEERRGLLADRQVMQERTRIARELHDVVAHGVSGIVVQAGAGRRGLEPGKPAADVLGEIEQRGRETLTELRRLLGVLRLDPEEPAAPLTPQPGLADLPALLASVTRSGVRSHLTESGERGRVADGLGLVVYRVVQESLTNVVKHSSARAAEVSLRWTPAEVEVEVRDRGVPVSPVAPGSGYGLRAMTERVQAYGGQVLLAGPCPDGFQVRVRIPFGDAT